LDEPEEKAKHLSDKSSPGSDGSEYKPSGALPARPMEPAKPYADAAVVQTDAQPPPSLAPSSLTSDGLARPGFNAAALKPAEQAKAQPDQTAIIKTDPAKSAPAVYEVQPAEQAKPLPAGPSSTESLMQKILPAEKSKTDPDIPAVDKTNKKIIAVGGAKGGVGKSMLAANLAVGLALLGQKVVLADLDLGGADVHLYTGVKNLAKTWNDFLDKKVESIQEILTPTAFKGLSLIGGILRSLGVPICPIRRNLKSCATLKNWRLIFWSSTLGATPLLMDWISFCWPIRRLSFQEPNRRRCWTATHS
jgi:Mrp family chromosome partitioning ATPase